MQTLAALAVALMSQQVLVVSVAVTLDMQVGVRAVARECMAVRQALAPLVAKQVSLAPPVGQ
jgi:hypothetical protein